VTETGWTAAVGKSAFDRIGLHRLTSGFNPGAPLILFLPGTNMNGELPLTDPDHWLPLYLAVHGCEVWALDYRTHFVPPDTPQPGLAELRGWTDARFVSDIDAAVNFILTAAAGRAQRRLYIAGFSRGAAFAYLYAAEHPQKLAGLIILDGFILRRGSLGGPKISPPAAWATDIGGKSLTYDKRKALLELVIRDPKAPAPIARYRTAAENLDQVVYESKAFGGRGGLANPAGHFSDALTLARVLITYDRYWPAVQDDEDPMTPELSRKLAASKLPVIAFASTNISPRWPSWVAGAAAQTGGPHTVIILAGWGHLDILCGTRAAARVYAPVRAWLTRHAAEERGRAAGFSAAPSAGAPRPGPTSQSTGR